MADSEVRDGFWVAQRGIICTSTDPHSIDLIERFDTRDAAEVAAAKRPSQYYRPFFVLELDAEKRTAHKRKYRTCMDCGSLVPRD